jgi:hypothetical protein
MFVYIFKYISSFTHHYDIHAYWYFYMYVHDIYTTYY